MSRPYASSDGAGTFRLADRTVQRLGYGAMQLAGPGVFGPPRDEDQALAVLREAAARGVNHLDTSDYYGPHITNRLIRSAAPFIPGTSSLAHLRENLAAAELALPSDALLALDGIKTDSRSR